MKVIAFFAFWSSVYAGMKDEYTELGCFADRVDKAISGGNFVKFEENVVTNCYILARRNGYSVFAIEGKRYCLTSRDAHQTFSIYGFSRSCYHGTGGPFAMTVYEIKPSGTFLRDIITFQQGTIDSLVSKLKELGYLQKKYGTKVTKLSTEIQKAVIDSSKQTIEVDENVDNITRKIDRLEDRLTELGDRQKNAESNITNISTQTQKAVHNSTNEIKEVKQKVHTITENILTLEKKVKALEYSQRNATTKMIKMSTEIQKAVRDTSTEIVAVNQNVDNISDKISNLEKKLKELELLQTNAGSKMTKISTYMQEVADSSSKEIEVVNTKVLNMTEYITEFKLEPSGPFLFPQPQRNRVAYALYPKYKAKCLPFHEYRNISSNILIKESTPTPEACIVRCYEARRDDKAINGLRFWIPASHCYCQRGTFGTKESINHIHCIFS